MSDQHTILLVDDSDNDLILMRRAFQKAKCQNPLQAVRSGEEAIAYLKGEGPYSDRKKFPLPAIMLDILATGGLVSYFKAHHDFRDLQV